MRVAVLRGGRSSEHEVSLNSGASVADGLSGAGHDVVIIEVGRDGHWRVDGAEIALAAGGGLLSCDVAFPVLHGPFGEDGTVQGLFEILDVPYVGAGVLASAACMDKVVFKELMAQAGLPQVGYVLMIEGDSPAGAAALGYPCWVKPARLGSSVGIARVAQESELEPALRTAFAHDPRVIVEASAPGIEVECAVLGHTLSAQASTPGEIVLRKGSGWYDYEAKYSPGGMELEVPARISGVATRARAGAGRRRVRGVGLQRARAGRLLRRRRRRIGQRAQHDARVHRDVGLREAVGGVGRALRRARHAVV